MDLRDVFAANLRRWRYEKGLSQEDLADRANINRTYISKLETGQTYAGLEIIGKLADVLEIEPAELLQAPLKKGRRRANPTGAK
jgi:transcriptional regulator with XRE-family HTH domain